MNVSSEREFTYAKNQVKWQQDSRPNFKAEISFPVVGLYDGVRTGISEKLVSTGSVARLCSHWSRIILLDDVRLLWFVYDSGS